MQTPRTSAVRLQHVASICHTLDSLCNGGFGPNGSNTLLCTSTGQIMVTNNGLLILNSLNIEHPIGNLICSSVKMHSQWTGDGSKTFMCLLSGIIEHLQNKTDRNAQEQNERLSLAKSVGIFKTTLLPSILKSVEEDYSERHSLRDMTHTQLKQLVWNVVYTFLQSSFPITIAKHFAELTTKFTLPDEVDQSGVCVELLVNHVACCVDYMEELYTNDVGRHPCMSSVIDGVVIERDFLQYISGKENSTALVIVNCSLAGDDYADEPDAMKPTLLVNSPSQLESAFRLKYKHAESFVTSLRTNGISLILSSVRVSEMEVRICESHGVSVVHLLAESTVSYLVEVCGIEQVHSYRDCLEMDPCQLKYKCCYKPTVIGGKRMVHLNNIESTGNEKSCDFKISKISSLEYSKHFIICGPSPGTCHQLRTAVHNCAKSLLLLLSQGPETSSAPKYSTTPGEGAAVHRFTSLPDTILTVPGGGFFEIAIYKALMKYTNISDPHLKLFCRALQAACLSIPLRLLNRSFSSSAPFTVISVMEMMRQQEHKCFGVDGRRGVMLGSDAPIVEPFAVKVATLYAVVELLEQLLRLEALVPATTQT